MKKSYRSYPYFFDSRSWAVCLGLLVQVALGHVHAHAQSEPTIVSTVPANLAVGVSVSAPVVITFSEEMDPDFTSVEFYDSTTFATLSTTDSWNSAHTVLTCAPTPAFPVNRMILWSASGMTPGGALLEGTTGGIFTTGTGGSGGGSGTNRITSFTIGKSHTYVQSSTGDPVLDPDFPYGFSAQTTLASNRTATSISMLLPTGGVSNLFQIPGRAEQWVMVSASQTQAAFDATFPNGNYTFTVTAPTSNQQVTVVLPGTATQPQPPVPRVANLGAGQDIDAGQPFTLQWNPISGAGTADYIFVEIGEAFRTPDPGSPGALGGAATSVVIPAGTLQPGTTYDGTLGFYRVTTNSFGTSHVTAAFRATLTRFTLVTRSTGGSSLVLTNSAWNGFFFQFEVLSAPGQKYSVESGLAPTGPWSTILTTNAPASGRVQVVDPRSFSEPALFYRARKTP